MESLRNNRTPRKITATAPTTGNTIGKIEPIDVIMSETIEVNEVVIALVIVLIALLPPSIFSPFWIILYFDPIFIIFKNSLMKLANKFPTIDKAKPRIKPQTKVVYNSLISICKNSIENVP